MLPATKLLLDTKRYMLPRGRQHVAGQHVARPRNMLPGNMLPWCKRGLIEIGLLNCESFLSRVSILLLTRDIDIPILSVSVCPSVTRWYCMKTAQHIVIVFFTIR